MLHPTPIWTKHEIFALAVRACVKATLLLGLVWPETDNRILLMQAAAARLEQRGQQELLDRPQPAKKAHYSEWSAETASRFPVTSLRG